MKGESPIRVLLVDDQQIIVESVREMLQSESDIAFHFCLAAARALAEATEVSPTVILQDLVMPGGNGLDLVRQYRAHEPTMHVPVVILSVKEDPEVKAEAFRLGVNDYLVKLPSAVELIARIRYHSGAYLSAAESRLAYEALRESREQLRQRNDEIRRQRDVLAGQARELAEKNAQLGHEIAEREALISELDAFARTVAHDLKSPVGPIVYYAEQLRDSLEGPGWASCRDWAETILEAGTHMVGIIDSLLLLARVRSGEVEMEPVDMGAVVQRLLERHELAIRKTEAVVRAAEAWPRAVGYAPWIEEIWSNYLSNAIKYGGRPPLVELGGAAMENGFHRFWVRDNGKGLNPEQCRRLFTPFTRLHTDLPGHGLGLSIVQRVVERLGGAVAVVSPGKSGQGSEFSFTLPAAK